MTERGGGREEVFCVAFSQGTWDTLHMSTSVMVRSPHSQSNVNLISSGLKEASNNPNYSSSFYGHQRRRDDEMKTSFRELVSLLGDAFFTIAPPPKLLK